MRVVQTWDGDRRMMPAARTVPALASSGPPSVTSDVSTLPAVSVLQSPGEYSARIGSPSTWQATHAGADNASGTVAAGASADETAVSNASASNTCGYYDRRRNRSRAAVGPLRRSAAERRSLSASNT